MSTSSATAVVVCRRRLQRREIEMRAYSRALAAIACGAAVLVSLGDLSAQQSGAGAQSQRILSIGGDVTEIIYALGAGSRIVAVDATSQFPPEALKEKKSVGYMRALSPEGVLSVAPDLVVATDRAGPIEIVRTLKSALPYVEVPEGSSSAGLEAKIRAVARAIGDEAAGDRLARKVTEELGALAAERRGIKVPLRALFVLNVQNGRAIVGGSGTSADAVFQLAGLQNAAAELAGFKPVNDEALYAMRPDLIVALNNGPGGVHGGVPALSLPGLANSPARANGRFVEMDALYLLGFGPRIAAAAHELMRAAYPDLAHAQPSR